MPSGIPITAYSACNGLGQTTAEVLDGLFQGRCGLREAGPELIVPTFVGAVPDPLPALPSSLAAYEGRQARIATMVCEPMIEAIEAAKRRFGASRVGLIIGTSTAGIAASERAWVHHRDTGALPEGYAIERQHALYATVEVIRAITGIGGPGYVVSTACSASGKVFASARRLIDAGIVDAVLVGGVDSLCQMTVRGFASLEVLSPERCRPFSSERRGINIGEGGALLLLERRDARVEGLGVELLGVGESSDAHHMTAPHPEGLGALAAMQQALDLAGVEAGEVEQINVHGTGTAMNDATESKAIHALFGALSGALSGAPGATPEAPRLPGSLAIVATKGYTGHMLGAAGATEAIFALATIERGEIPASLGAAPLDASLAMPINLERRPWTTRRVLSNSLAFGGSNVSVLLGVGE